MLTLTTLALAATLQAQDFAWSGPLAAGKLFTVKNVGGDIAVERASGRTLDITAVKRAGRHGRPADVEVRRVETGEGIELCVIYPAMGNTRNDCSWEGDRRSGDRRREENDTEVHFTIRLPVGVHLNASNVSGSIRVDGARGRVEVASVSGSVRVRDAEAATLKAQSVSGDLRLDDVRSIDVDAETVSGSVAFTGPIRPGGAYDFTSVSGEIAVGVPAGTGAEVAASSFSGRLTTSFALGSAGARKERYGRSRMSGTIGGGGGSIRVTTLSGDVSIREAARP